MQEQYCNDKNEEKEVFELKSDDVSFDYETVVHKGLEGIE